MRSFFCRYWRTMLLYGILALVATVFVLAFSVSTSPIYKNYYYSSNVIASGGDSLHFQTDGLSWLHGQVPYRDFFDHKGPLIFLFNMIGLLIGGGSRYGIAVVQIIALTVTLVFVWKISQLAKKSTLFGGISVVLSLVFLTAMYNVGNSVQEYNLPFIMVAMYYVAKYFFQPKQAEHNPWWAFAYGVGIGSCLLLQVTDAIPICASILVIVILLVKQKLWKNLLHNILYCIAGFLVIWLPFALYFLFNGAFGDYIYVSIIYNFSYASKVGSWLKGADGGAIYLLLTVYIPYFCGIGAAILAFARKKWGYASAITICCLLETYLFLKGQLFPQYPIPLLFQIGFLLNEVILFKHEDEARNLVLIGMVSLITMLTYNQVTSKIESAVNQYQEVRNSIASQPEYVSLMDKYNDKIHDSSFVVYAGGLETKGLYMRYNIVPVNRFPLIQSWLASFSDKVHDEVFEDIENSKVEYILTTQADLDYEPYSIKDILKENYKLIDQNGSYYMYQLKEAAK